MNKYQEALNFLEKIEAEKNYKLIGLFYYPQCDILQELVDKETLKKVIIKKYGNFNVGDYYCPHCNCKINEEFEPKYCSECGQKLDWSDEVCHQK